MEARNNISGIEQIVSNLENISKTKKDISDDVAKKEYGMKLSVDVSERLGKASKVHYISTKKPTDKKYEEAVKTKEKEKPIISRDTKLKASLDLNAIEERKFKHMDNSAFLMMYDWILMYLKKMYHTKVVYEPSDFVSYIKRSFAFDMAA